MSFSLHGLAVSGGIAIGRAHLISHATLEVSHQQLQERDVTSELARLDAAIRVVSAELESLREEASLPGALSEVAAFVDLHAMILEDPALVESARDLISERWCNRWRFWSHSSMNLKMPTCVSASTTSFKCLND